LLTFSDHNKYGNQQTTLIVKRYNYIPQNKKSVFKEHVAHHQSFFYSLGKIILFLSARYLLTIVQEVSNLVLDVAAKITNTVQDTDLAFV